MTIKEDDIVLCTVKSIDRNVIQVEIEGSGPAILSLPEVAAGRIRNIRDYVSIGKKIVCKVLRIIDGHPHLSLRRVTSGEKQQVLERNKKEKVLLSMLKTSIKDPEKTLEKIKEKYQADEFLDEARENPRLLEKFVTKTQASTLAKIIAEKKEKEKEVKASFKITSQSEQGLDDIKEVLNCPLDIRYLGSSNFSISSKAKDFKTADNQVQKALDEIKAKAKKKHTILTIKEK